MWAVADAVTAQLDHAAVSIQSYRRVYSSGGHKDWPAHRGRAGEQFMILQEYFDINLALCLILP
jgi:hypothetical protein